MYLMPASVRLGLFLVLCTLSSAFAQAPRPVPYPVFLPGPFQHAITQGTRTLTGEPGPKYWQNHAAYTIAATFNPATNQVDGQVHIQYTNHSPNNIPELVLHLRQNVYAEGAVRNRPVETTGGVNLLNVRLGDSTLTAIENPRTFRQSPGYFLNGTLLYINPGEPLASGASVDLHLGWHYQMPIRSFRNGQDGEIFYAAYWYPQVAMYDDLTGWHADPYMGNGEFYMSFADYEVSLTLPEGWLVAATGTLQNPEAVLSLQTRERLAQAAQTKETIRVVETDDRQPGRSTADSDSGMLTWQFKAEQVRDFVWGTSDQYLWDATSTNVGDRDGDGTSDTALIHAFYRPEFDGWAEAAEVGQFSIAHLSETFFPYPYPHMTLVEGLRSGGMEYPMMTFISGPREGRRLFGVSYHEIAHMWFPMVVASDEKSYGWMDEGLTSFNTNLGSQARYDDDAVWDTRRQGYYRIAGSQVEHEIMRHSDQFPLDSPARSIALYNKPSVALHALRGLFGEERFMEAYRTYAQRWRFKHPQPYDLFNTFEDVLGEDLDWFWTPLFFETWTLDHAVADIDRNLETLNVTIEDRGLTPMPTSVRVTYTDGRTVEQTIPVSTWLSGERAVTLTFEPGSAERVEIDPEGVLPDVNRSNNVWPGE